jgi:hypothetical protein
MGSQLSLNVLHIFVQNILLISTKEYKIIGKFGLLDDLVLVIGKNLHFLLFPNVIKTSLKILIVWVNKSSN